MTYKIKDPPKLGRRISHRTPAGEALWELLVNEFQVPTTAQQVVVTLTLEDIRVAVEYWPQQLPVEPEAAKK